MLGDYPCFSRDEMYYIFKIDDINLATTLMIVTKMKIIIEKQSLIEV